MSDNNEIEILEPQVYTVTIKVGDGVVNVCCGSFDNDLILPDHAVMKDILNIRKKFMDDDTMEVSHWSVAKASVISWYYGTIEIEKETEGAKEEAGGEPTAKKTKKSRGVKNIKKPGRKKNKDKKSDKLADLSLPDGHEAEELFDEDSI